MITKLVKKPYKHFSVDAKSLGTLNDPIIDSNMTKEQALFIGLPHDCPQEIIKRQYLITVCYFSLDGLVHQGQLILDKRLTGEIQKIFQFALSICYQFGSVIPISHSLFKWNDEISMSIGLYGNSSAFNFRTIARSTKLSNHSKGQAIDINPKINPYIKGDFVQPVGAIYNPKIEGTLTKEHLLVIKFKEMGWEWGGDWIDRKDYQHFQKVLE